MGVDDNDGVAVAARGLLPQLVGDEVAHEGRLAHARARHVEVVAPQQVVGEVDRLARAGDGLPHGRAAAGAPGVGVQDFRAGASHEGRLVAGAGWVPEGGHLAYTEGAALPEEARRRRFDRGLRQDGPDPPVLETRAHGVVVVVVGGDDAAEEVASALLRAFPGEDGGHLQLGREGRARDLLLDQGGVVHAVTAALPALPEPEAGDAHRERAYTEEGGLEGLAALHPLPALEGDEADHGEDSEGEGVHAARRALRGGRGRRGRPLSGRLPESELLVGLRPVRAESAQEEAGDDAFALLRGGERSQQGDEGVGTGVEQVVVAERAQGHVVGAGGGEGQAPGLLALGETQGILLGGELLDAGLGVVGGDLLAHDLAVAAADEHGDAVTVPGQLQGEGFWNRDRLEEVLDAEQGCARLCGAA